MSGFGSSCAVATSRKGRTADQHISMNACPIPDVLRLPIVIGLTNIMMCKFCLPTSMQCHGPKQGPIGTTNRTKYGFGCVLRLRLLLFSKRCFRVSWGLHNATRIPINRCRAEFFFQNNGDSSLQNLLALFGTRIDHQNTLQSRPLVCPKGVADAGVGIGILG